jgi:hypothetical protein
MHSCLSHLVRPRDPGRRNEEARRSPRRLATVILLKAGDDLPSFDRRAPSLVVLRYVRATLTSRVGGEVLRVEALVGTHHRGAPRTLGIGFDQVLRRPPLGIA